MYHTNNMRKKKKKFVLSAFSRCSQSLGSMKCTSWSSVVSCVRMPDWSLRKLRSMRSIKCWNAQKAMASSWTTA